MHSVAEGIGEINEMLKIAPSSAANELENGMLQVPLDLNERIARFSIIPDRSSTAGQPSSQMSSSVGRNSAVMVEEESPDWLEMREQGI